jgi:hypothetical protein
VFHCPFPLSFPLSIPSTPYPLPPTPYPLPYPLHAAQSAQPPGGRGRPGHREFPSVQQEAAAGLVLLPPPTRSRAALSLCQHLRALRHGFQRRKVQHHQQRKSLSHRPLHPSPLPAQYYSTQELAATTTYNTALPTTTAGKAVSFTSSGGLQTGAGSSLYLNVSSNFVGSDACPAYLSMDSFDNNLYLYAYANKETYKSTLQLLQMTSAREAKLLATTTVDYFVYELAALDKSKNSFIMVCQDYSNSSETAYVVSGSVDMSSLDISVLDEQIYAANFSVDPAVTRLSDSSFAIAYYNTDPSMLATRVGTVDSSGKVQLYKAGFYSSNPDYSKYFSIAPLSASSFLIAYYDSSTNTELRSGPLNALLAKVNADYSLSFSNSTASSSADFSAAYSLQTAALDENNVVVVFANANDNYNLVAQLITVLDNNIVPSNAGDFSIGTSHLYMQPFVYICIAYFTEFVN